MTSEVIEFNKKRNQLELNAKLEVDMIEEKIKKFFDATTVAERVDAYVDTTYVWIGTKAKYSYNRTAMNVDTERWIRMSIHLMADCLMEELGSDFPEVMEAAKKIVCRVNMLKGETLAKNGKVLKGSEIPDATKEIALMIEDVMRPKSY